MENSTYYDILQVSTEAAPEEIRSAYRRLAFKFHPDRNSNRSGWAKEKFKKIRQAYDTLSHPKKRRDYDNKKIRPARKSQIREPYWEKLRRKKDLSSRCKIVLHDLLQGRRDQAIKQYEALCREEAGFTLQDNLNTRDYLDTLFLLGEEYERRKKMKRAAAFYEEVFRTRNSAPGRKLLFESLREKLFEVYCASLPDAKTYEEAVELFRKASLLNLYQKEQSTLCKQMAIACMEIDRPDKARTYLRQALDLNPKLKGVKKLCSKLKLKAS